MDKIKETKRVLETIIALQMSQIEQEKPQKFVSPDIYGRNQTAEYY